MGFSLSDYHLKIERYQLGALDYRVCSLLDTNQRTDDASERDARIPDAYWPFFGLVWESGLLLAAHLAQIDLDGVRVLEIGCGLALPGIVSHRLGADVIVSDLHPLAERFLRRNLSINGLGALPYLDIDWTQEHPRLGRFDRIIASDVCYLPEHPAEIAHFIESHGTDAVQVIVADPGRPGRRMLTRALLDLGLVAHEAPPRAGRVRVTTYSRVDL